MVWAKRIFLFVVVNALVVLTISILLNVFRVRPYLTAHGIDYRALLVFCVIWGMSGAFISLFLSKSIVKWTMGVKIIDPEATQDPRLQRIIQSVYRSAETAGLTVMPEVGMYSSPQVNAFATGPGRDNALVAVSTGLFQRLSPEEVDGVIGHEIAHIANGDMVTMTLIQGIVNAFVIFFARVIAFAFMGRGRDERDNLGLGSTYLVVFVFENLLMFFGMIVVAWFSRYREFRADAGGAQIAGRNRMLAALQGLHRTYTLADHPKDSQFIQTLKISSQASRFSKLFSTHPPLQERILRLQAMPRD